MNPITQVTTLLAEVQARLNSLNVDHEALRESMEAAILSLAWYDWAVKGFFVWNLLLTVLVIWLAFRRDKGNADAENQS